MFYMPLTFIALCDPVKIDNSPLIYSISLSIFSFHMGFLLLWRLLLLLFRLLLLLSLIIIIIIIISYCANIPLTIKSAGGSYFLKTSPQKYFELYLHLTTVTSIPSLNFLHLVFSISSFQQIHGEKFKLSDLSKNFISPKYFFRGKLTVLKYI